MSAEDEESAELTAIFERISRRENEITALDSSIVHLLESEDEIARDVEETLTLQDKVSVIKTRITKYIQNKNPPVRSNQHASHAPSTSKKHVNLPKMTLKTFHGNLWNGKRSGIVLASQFMKTMNYQTSRRCLILTEF